MNNQQPKKIGILTLPLNENIGGNLQAYALMEKLRQLGHEPVLINRRYHPQGYPNDVPAKYLAIDNGLNLYAEFTGFKDDLPNLSFINHFISPVTRPYQWSKQLARHIERYQFDAIIVGSDQVWRADYAQEILADFFLGFLNHQSAIKRICYGASFGTNNWQFDKQQTQLFGQLLKRFDAVSVREDSAVELCKKYFGVAADHVLDPTLLLPAKFYIDTFDLSKNKSNEKKLVTYLLDKNADKSSVVDSIAQSLSLKSFNTNHLPFDAHIENDTNNSSTVENWLSSIYQADFVVTDSFHGVVFSIIFNKPFIAYANPKRGLARFTSILKLFGLQDRLIINSAELDLNRIHLPINWTQINHHIETLRAYSVNFLQTSLTSIQKTQQTFPRIQVAQINQHPLRVLCSGCGVCVSESNGALAMQADLNGFLVPVANGQQIPAGTIKVCPFNPNPERDVLDEDVLAKKILPTAPNIDDTIGRFENTYVGFSEKYRVTSSSGGITTYILEKLLNNGIVDYLYVVQKDNHSGYSYQIFDGKQDITSVSKTRYYPVTLDELFSIIENTDGRVAVSAVPCFIKAIRLKQHYHPELKQKIPFVLGIFCGGLKSKHYTDFLAQSAGITDAYSDSEYRVKDASSSAKDYSFAALDQDGSQHSIKMSRLGDMWGSGMFKASACDFCTDITAELADISFGDAWLPEYNADGMGNSIVVTRSKIADEIILSGINKGEIQLQHLTLEKVKQSQLGGINHRQKNIIFRFWYARNFTDIPLPILRRRFLRKISANEALIQVLRERTRARSLSLWRKTKNFSSFYARISPSLRMLNEVTYNARHQYQSELNQVMQSIAANNKLTHSQLNIQSKPYRALIRWLTQLSRKKNLNFYVAYMALKKGILLIPNSAEKDLNKSD